MAILPPNFNAFAAATFFSVDRYASYKQDWGQFYEQGGLVIADRYTTSNAVHQTGKLPEGQRQAFLDWLFDFEYRMLGLPAPTRVLYLDLPTEMSGQMMRRREQETGTHADIHEQDAGYLRRCRENAAFVVDLVIMVVVATFIYGYLFKKTNYNVLYVLLIGTVLSSFFGSIQETMVRVMDPNEYDNLLLTLVAGFDNINGEIIAACAGILALMAFILRKELALLDVITLGKDQAINLGVDYDKTVGKLLIGVTACIAVATAMVGPISFLGLIIANLGRQIMKTYRHSHLILGASLFGMMTLVGGQWIVEHLAAYTVPVSTFITLGGGIYFLYLLLQKR